MLREVIRDEQGQVVAATCTAYSLSEQARQAIAAVARDVRLQMEIDDPDNLLGDRRQRAVDRLHRRPTPECGATYCDLVCTRPAGHIGQCVTACGTQRWGG